MMKRSVATMEAFKDNEIVPMKFHEERRNNLMMH